MTSPFLFLLLLATIILNFIIQSFMARSDYTISGRFLKYLVVANRLPVSGPIINIMNEEWTNSVTSLKDSSVCDATGHCNQKCSMLEFFFLLFFLPSITSPTTCTAVWTNRMTECSDLNVNMVNAPFRHSSCLASPDDL